MERLPSIPAATYRLQFNKNWTFGDAERLVPYLKLLGITHVYASPIFKAPEESNHGYDVADHNELNPVLGGRAGYEAFVAQLAAHGMQMIVDFVPNHMGVARSINPLWLDVLENGPSSIYAPYFDINWRPLKEQLENKVLLPILGDQYGRVLERGEFRVRYDQGRFCVQYYETSLPMAPRSYGIILRRALARLAERYSGEDFYLELQSILTAIDHLPARTDREPESVEERAREKEIIKRRLARACEESPQVLDAIEHVLHELAGRPGDARSFDALDELLQTQPYRLSYWRVAAEEINYRRFFDINELAAIRMELGEVWEATHKLLFELIGDVVTGVRIDHVDGLWNPREYLEKLQVRAAERWGRATESRPLYLLTEKILSGNEQLRPDWPIHGTTGYDFTSSVTAVLVDSGAEKDFTRTYEEFVGERSRIEDLVYEKKQQVMRLSMASEINTLAYLLNRLSEHNRWYRDFTLGALTTAVREVIASFPVYRTYLVPEMETSDVDRQVIQRAISAAKRRNPAMERSIFDFLQSILLLQYPENVDEEGRAEQVNFVMKFQQCTGPVMAKGLEDTSFYLFNRLVALNEVGGEPQRFGSSVEEFHQQNATRLRQFPHSMLATSTHDTKKNEDVRARLAAISEMPVLWRRSLQRWRTINRKWKREVDGKMAPDANEEYLLYQILLGTWPSTDEEKRQQDAYVGRIQDYMAKAVREGKVNSSWIQPNEAWDEAVQGFIAAVLAPENRRFRRVFEPVAADVAEAGMLNALSQTVLKCTAPGVPDFYQGTETWDFSLVDPDNRRPVDYERRREMLERIGKAKPGELLEKWTDGRIKMFVIERLLRLRNERRDLFARGDYAPCAAGGDFAGCVIAFERRQESGAVLVVVPRLTRRVAFWATGDAWGKTSIEVTGGEAVWRNVFTGAEVSGGTVLLRDVFREFPVAVLVRA
jgi:(1->4)-alpha-D-glucan 1-alpha-D-glucosylmutase